MNFPERLDVVVAAMPGVSSRARAARLIGNGQVLVNRQVVGKSSYPVAENDSVEILVLPSYVGIGGEKLQKALYHFSVPVKDTVWLDAGASTGGFTDCLLQQGASHVFAVDIGSAQLHPSLRSNPRVSSFEHTDIRHFSLKEHFSGELHGICADLSFISLSIVLPALLSLSGKETRLLLLLKPQFETPRSSKNKKGIVRNESLRLGVLQDSLRLMTGAGLVVHGSLATEVEDKKKKNTEYFIYASVKAHVENTDKGI